MFLQQLVTGISVGGIYALLATGYSLIYSLLDFSNWAHGEFAMGQRLHRYRSVQLYGNALCSRRRWRPWQAARW